MLSRGQMFDPRCNLLREQTQGVVPDLRIFSVVKAENQEVPKAADLTVNALQLLRHG